jgi:hypothetical protein
MDKQLESSERFESDLQGDEQVLHYRSISKAALAGSVFAVVGLLFLISNLLFVLPMIGLALSLIGLSVTRRYPDELTGKAAARFGLLVSGLTLLAGTAYHGYVIATEVPRGYQRISFRMLKDDPKTRLAFGEQAADLDGKKVFLKGWIRPGNRKDNLKDFILVGDFGTCCFGGSPKITDVVAVSIRGDERVSYGWNVRKVAGTFRLNREAAVSSEKGIPRVFYQIDADMVK